MTRPRTAESRARSVALTHVALGQDAPRPLPRPVRVRLAGPFEDGLYLGACPELGLACTGPAPAHCLGQIEGRIALALATGGRGLNAEGRRLARLLVAPEEPAVVPLGPQSCLSCGRLVPCAGNGHVRRYCSARCRRQHGEETGRLGEDRTCTVCGEVFHVKRRGVPTRTCSPPCAGRLRRGRRRKRP